MKRTIITASITAFSLGVYAQELPMPSPKAKVEQRVGLTDVTIEYSRPSVKGRKIFGELVPYGELWRTGANMNTTVEFNTSVELEGKTLEKGKYSLITIPKQQKWVIIFNRDTKNWGTSDYKQEQDALRVDVAHQKYGELVETFTINIGNLKDESAEIQLLWENTKISIPFKVDVEELAENNIKNALEDAEEEKKWRVYRNAANYYYNKKMKLETALAYMEKSLEANSESWYSHWLYAEVLAEMGEYEEAVGSAQEAIEVGKKAAKGSKKGFTYEKMISSSIEKWGKLENQ